MHEPVRHGVDAPCTVLSGATVIDGRGEPPTAGADVVISGERIVAIGPVGTIEHPAGASVVDCRGKFVLPGLIDVHVHYFEWMGELFLAHGVTTVKDVGNDVDWIATASDEIAGGAAVGPRIVFTGNGLDVPPPRRDHFIGIESDDMARRVVRLLHERGAIAIKVREMLPAALLPPIVDEAHRLGMKVTGHLRTMTARDALAAGIDGLEHASGIVQATMPPGTSLGLDRLEAVDIYAKYVAERRSYSLIDEPRADALVDDLAAAGVALIPTMSGWWRMATPRRDAFAVEDARYADDPDLAYVPDEARSIWQTSRLYRIDDESDLAELRLGYRKIQDVLMHHRAAGGAVLAGSDTFLSVPGLSLQRELVFFVDMGIPPLEAIRIATLDNAAFIGLDAELGSVEPGKRADLVVLDADPLADIANIASVAAVYRNGESVDLRYHADHSVPTPRPPMVRPLWVERRLLAEGYRFVHPTFPTDPQVDDQACC